MTYSSAVGFSQIAGVAANFDFSGQGPNIANGLVVDGKLWIGSTALNAGGTHINVGSITSPLATVSIGYSSPNITLDVRGGSLVNSITAGANINLSGSAANPIINLNNIILEPNSSRLAPTYSFSSNSFAGMYYDGALIGLAADTGFPFLTGNLSNLTIASGNTFIQYITMQGGISYTYTNPGAYPYSAISSDYYISVDSSAARTINLPNAPTTDRVFIIKDRTGNASTHNITVTTPGGVVLFDGATSFLITSNYGIATFIFNGTSYEVT